jgi:hypothetical protein
MADKFNLHDLISFDSILYKVASVPSVTSMVFDGKVTMSGLAMSTPVYMLFNTQSKVLEAFRKEIVEELAIKVEDN